MVVGNLWLPSGGEGEFAALRVGTNGGGISAEYSGVVVIAGTRLEPA